MEEENSKRNAKDRGPSRTSWPPAWLAGAGGPTERWAAGLAARSSTLPVELREAWEERVCIMHHDGGRPWDEAERLALADVLDNTHDRRTVTVDDNP
jgi:hypothetical protein